MDVNEFEYNKQAFREEMRPAFIALNNKTLYFDDDFDLSNLPTDRDRIFTSIRAIVQFSLLYPNVRVYFQLANYLALASLMEEAYNILTHATLIAYGFLDHVGAVRARFEKFHLIGFQYEHLLYLLSKSNTYIDYAMGYNAANTVVPDIVNKDIPFICYKREMSHFNMSYFFANQSLEVINKIRNRTLKNDVNFVKCQILKLVPNVKTFPASSQSGSLAKDISRVTHAEIDENLYLNATVLDEYGNNVKCYMKVEETELVDYDCECSSITQEFAPCEHLQILNRYFVFILSTYFFFGQQ